MIRNTITHFETLHSLLDSIRPIVTVDRVHDDRGESIRKMLFLTNAFNTLRYTDLSMKIDYNKILGRELPAKRTING